ncbi:protease complex subunit PrcB family protein [Flavobacterium sp. MMLR14_040]|uniref:protease complex subunit PrcB family protein n=1 Tax=Flavobacterium sp. MMLR14_040 TaxID=3093843 RepID=UPI00298F7DE0|nr:protease complex subunit PrcB family protein [Flavobacterium sp. MMLR14_040]MDW8851660.1 protease complex subunit PrcB family protein [Flavobacterium sp. MMLR14_040]
MKQIITILSILFLFASCDNADSETADLDFSTVLQGDHFNGNYGNTKENLVIKDQQTWSDLISKMNPFSDTNYYFPDATIDFTKYQVIVVIDEVRNYGGYSIDITKITQNNNSIFITVEQLKPGGINAVITQPFHIVKIPKTGKKVVFK